MEKDKQLVILTPEPTGPGEDKMISQSQWGAVHTLYESGMKKKAIARHLDLDIKTVRKWLGKTFEQQHRSIRGRSQLDPLRPFIEARAPEVGYNAAVLLRELQPLGYKGSYSTLANYISPMRARVDLEPTLRFETEPGKQAQVDWGSTYVYLGEERVRVHIFVMVLGYSRRCFVRAYMNERLDSLLDAHEAAFDHFGGRTSDILYDNPRTILSDKDQESGEVKWNKTFKDRMDFYGVNIRLCRYYRAQTKGKVESGVKYVKRNALAGRRFRDLEDLNNYLLEWCLRVADERIHGTTHERPRERFARSEAAALIAVDRRAPRRERVEHRIVPQDALVSVDTNRYPVPTTWVGRTVDVRRVDGKLLLSCEEETIRYRPLEGKYKVASWEGPPRAFKSPPRPKADPPKFDLAYLSRVGDVEVRPLSIYENLANAQEVCR